jgi:proteasome lid subunit RPN8/RPN11
MITRHDAASVKARRRRANADLFVSEAALQQMLGHADEGAESNSEVMGLLAGNVFKDAVGMYAEVAKVVTSGLLSSDVSVRFDRSGMKTLFDALDGLNFEYVIVGWYHSHLGIGCFMSETDLKTHASAFSGFGFAIVVDAVKKELKAFKSADDGVEEASMVVIEDQTQIA